MKKVGIVLAGGEGKRAGGHDKGLLTLNNIPLVQHVIEKIKDDLDTLFISANRNFDFYHSFSYPVVRDKPEYCHKGPLGGIASVYTRIPKNTEMVMVVPCDVPFLPKKIVSLMTKSLLSQVDYEIAYASTLQRIHPSIHLFKYSIGVGIAHHLNHGEYSLKSWIFKHKVIKTLFPDEKAFINMNDLTLLNRYQHNHDGL
ncbi:Molybdenum cofactor guanylyltransferase [Commensalibacter sp. Nvir]|uniref:molybdenum cofactor guanylyltransferase n=1 Tax=Commensalibacter sp. Nvir TaxID=3069817 RepID=UPI002D66968A|nr:Molybdenum cofactor guanylyltransferase [Commensalibacter sp. Nvir]